MSNDDFIMKIEEIYKNELIYRALVVSDIGDAENIKNIFEENDHSVKIFKKSEDIDYNILDCRIFVIEYLLYEEFLIYNILKYGIDNLPFNLIIYSCNIDNNIIEDLKEKYNKHTHNNNNKAIII